MAKPKWDKDKNRVTTALVRLNLPHLITPKSFNAETPHYMTGVLVPRTDKATVKILQAACKIAEQEQFPKGRPKKFIYPLRPGAAYAKEKELDVAQWQDYIYFRAKSKFVITIVGPNPDQEFSDEKLIYSGVNARVVVTCKGYDNQSKGVAFYLNMVQILPGGESMVSKPDPEDFFDQEDDFGDTDLDPETIEDDESELAF